MLKRFFATLKELRLSCGASRDTTLSGLRCRITRIRFVPGLQQPGLKLANAFSVIKAAELTAEPAINFNSGYLLRALHTLPRQGSKTPCTKTT